METPELKPLINKMESLLDGPNSIFEKTEKQINKLEDWSMEIIQSLQQEDTNKQAKIEKNK